MDLKIFEEMRKLFYYHSLLEIKGLFSKKITMDYEAGSYDPWLNFNCLSDEDLSFRVHNLEFGKERQDEATFLHTAVQRGKGVRFNGFINRFHFLGSKRIRGYLEVPSEHYRLGVVVNNGRVTELITTKEMYEIPSTLMLTLLFISQNSRRTTLADKI
jgi:hypothetical protein